MSSTVPPPLNVQFCVRLAGERREIEVVLEPGRRTPVTPTRLAVTLPALDLLVQLGALRDALGVGAGRARELERRRLLQGGEESRQALQVDYEIPPLLRGEDLLPPRHRGAGHPLVDDAQDIGIGGKLTGACGADLILRAGEVARPGQHRGGARPVAETLAPVAPGAPPVVRGFTRNRAGPALLSKRWGCRGARGHRKRTGEQHPPDQARH